MFITRINFLNNAFTIYKVIIIKKRCNRQK